MVIVKVGGGLGNQMSQYAAGKALALRQGSELRLDPCELLDPMPRRGAAKRPYVLEDFFVGDFPLIPMATFFKAIPVPYVPAIFGRFWGAIAGSLGFFQYVREKKSYVFESEVAALHGDVYLEGGWLTERYFKGYESAIRSAFVFRRPLTGAAAEIMEKIRKSKSVALHIRRGDKVWNNNSHILASQEYFDRALTVLTEKIGDDATLFIFSDEIDWCRKNLKFSQECVFVSGAADQPFRADEDLHLMSLCQHFIVPNSTFSWWGAWLSAYPEKICIAPKDMFSSNRFDPRDAFPPEWLRV